MLLHQVQQSRVLAFKTWHNSLQPSTHHCDHAVLQVSNLLDELKSTGPISQDLLDRAECAAFFCLSPCCYAVTSHVEHAYVKHVMQNVLLYITWHLTNRPCVECSERLQCSVPAYACSSEAVGLQVAQALESQVQAPDVASKALQYDPTTFPAELQPEQLVRQLSARLGVC